MSTPNPVKSGDVVALLSGGPPMTVDFVFDPFETGKFQAKCKWFDDNGAFYEQAFYLSSLRHVPES